MASVRPNEEREETIFAAAVEMPEAERTQYILDACRGDERLALRVLALLAAFTKAGDFLKAGAFQPPTLTSFVPIAEKSGDSIGRYKLLEQILAKEEEESFT